MNLMQLKNLKAHPTAEIFPPMDDDQFKVFLDDIKACGEVREPILVDKQNRIVDGLNRQRALLEIGDPNVKFVITTTESSEDAIRELVLSKNLARRHLSTSQRAMIAAELANLSHGGNRTSEDGTEVTIDEAAEKMNVSPALVKRAKAVKKKAPELAEKVKNGKTTVSKAHNSTKPAKKAAPKPAVDASEAADDVLDSLGLDGLDDLDVPPPAVKKAPQTPKQAAAPAAPVVTTEEQKEVEKKVEAALSPSATVREQIFDLLDKATDDDLRAVVKYVAEKRTSAFVATALQDDEN